MEAVPNTYSIPVQQESRFTLNLDDNSMNGASWISSITLDSVSPVAPWISFNSNNETIFSYPQLGDIQTYTLKYLIEESGVGPWTFIPILRSLTLYITKPPPEISYNIPDSNNLRVGESFEVNFPGAICTDPLGDSLIYSISLANGGSLPGYILFDISNNKLSGTVPAGNEGALNLKITWTDNYSQSKNQEFTLYFHQNNEPYQAVTNIGKYKVRIQKMEMSCILFKSLTFLVLITFRSLVYFYLLLRIK